VLLVTPAREPMQRPFAEAIALAPLTAADVEALVAAAGDGTAPSGAVAAIVAQSQGNAAIVGVLARRLIANLRAGRDAGASIDAGADLDGCSRTATARCRREARPLVLALALTDGADSALAIRELARRRRGGRGRAARPAGSRRCRPARSPAQRRASARGASRRGCAAARARRDVGARASGREESAARGRAGRRAEAGGRGGGLATRGAGRARGRRSGAGRAAL
jgi:hypothetical protein